jgi:hypothetical protein
MTSVSVPGSAKLSVSAREARTRRYRTRRGQRPGMAWCAECLLCGTWRSGCPTRELAARLGASEEYPRELAGRLFALAGGTRRYLPPRLDRCGTPHGGPEHGSGGYRWAG